MILYDSLLNVNALQIKVEKINVFGGKGSDCYEDVISTFDGGYIAVGYSFSTDGDMKGLNRGSSDAIIVKYDSKGNLKWRKSFGGSGDDGFTAVSTAKDGGYIVVGTSCSNDGNMKGLNRGKSDAVIVKYDTRGNIKWIRSFGGSLSDEFTAVIETKDGGYVATGHSYSSDKDMKGLNKGEWDGIIVKYDLKGNLKWKRGFGSEGDDGFGKLSETIDGGYIVFASLESKNGERNGFVIKFDSQGNIKWKKKEDANIILYDIVSLSNGSFIAAGVGSLKFDKYKDKAIICKYDANWNIQWIRGFGGSDCDIFNAIECVKNGGYIAVGFSGSKDGDLQGLNKGGYYAIIVKFDINGNIKWAKSFGGGGSSTVLFNAVSTKNDGRYMAVGCSRSEDGDMRGLSKGLEDAITVMYREVKY
ncbi:hypothetical protein [Caldicellulosiruptor bescii]|uniref:hypothetical protein n=1 Tax=Caldicellulosiruptor bescii TaxID=31899 RepID=UPI002093210D|nr:hypothetical protein [Caldicellulosiruptor bescii]